MRFILLSQVTDRNDRDFLKSWHEDNKPHVLLFDQVPVVPLLYKVHPTSDGDIWRRACRCLADCTNNYVRTVSLQLTAFAYKDYVQFGYVDQGLSETANLLKQYNINTYAPTMLVFKENTDKPADIIQAGRFHLF